MKLRSIVTVVSLILSVSVSQAETLNNDSIIQMKSLGINDDLIVMKIQSSEHEFDTSMEELSKLQKAGISTEVIKEMMSAKAKADDESDSLPDGEFFYKAGNKIKKMSPASLEQQLSNRKKFIPFANKSPENFIFFASPKSRLRFKDENIEFITKLEPNKFQLVKLGYHNSRETRFIVYQQGRSDRMQQFTSVPMDDGAYKIVISAATLGGGEYAFMVKPDLQNMSGPMAAFAHMAQQQMPPSTAYDFAIEGEEKAIDSVALSEKEED